MVTKPSPRFTRPAADPHPYAVNMLSKYRENLPEELTVLRAVCRLKAALQSVPEIPAYRPMGFMIDMLDGLFACQLSCNEREVDMYGGNLAARLSVLGETSEEASTAAGDVLARHGKDCLRYGCRVCDGANALRWMTGLVKLVAG